MADRASVWQRWASCTKRLRTAWAVLLGLFVVGGCTSYKSAYEKSVYDLEPVYCYRSLADVTCFRKPYFRDERRLANYYGPAPSKYDRPKPPPMAELQPPPPPDLDSVDDPDSVEDFDSADDGEEMEEDVGEERGRGGAEQEEGGGRRGGVASARGGTGAGTRAPSCRAVAPARGRAHGGERPSADLNHRVRSPAGGRPRGTGRQEGHAQNAQASAARID